MHDEGLAGYRSEMTASLPVRAKSGAPTIASDDLGPIFDIEIDDVPIVNAGARIRKKPETKKVVKKASKVKKATRVPKKG